MFDFLPAHFLLFKNTIYHLKIILLITIDLFYVRIILLEGFSREKLISEI